MKKKVYENPLFYNDDPEEISDLVKNLIRRKYFIGRPRKSHIKIGPVNFFPTTGAITVDGMGAARDNGIDALMLILARQFPPKITHTFQRRIPRSA